MPWSDAEGPARRDSCKSLQVEIESPGSVVRVEHLARYALPKVDTHGASHENPLLTRRRTASCSRLRGLPASSAAPEPLRSHLLHSVASCNTYAAPMQHLCNTHAAACSMHATHPAALPASPMRRRAARGCPPHIEVTNHQGLVLWGLRGSMPPLIAAFH